MKKIKIKPKFFLSVLSTFLVVIFVFSFSLDSSQAESTPPQMWLEYEHNQGKKENIIKVMVNPKGNNVTGVIFLLEVTGKDFINKITATDGKKPGDDVVINKLHTGWSTPPISWVGTVDEGTVDEKHYFSFASSGETSDVISADQPYTFATITFDRSSEDGDIDYDIERYVRLIDQDYTNWLLSSSNDKKNQYEKDSGGFLYSSNYSGVLKAGGEIMTEILCNNVAPDNFCIDTVDGNPNEATSDAPEKLLIPINKAPEGEQEKINSTTFNATHFPASSFDYKAGSLSPDSEPQNQSVNSSFGFLATDETDHKLNAKITRKTQTCNSWIELGDRIGSICDYSGDSFSNATQITKDKREITAGAPYSVSLGSLAHGTRYQISYYLWDDQQKVSPTREYFYFTTKLDNAKPSSVSNVSVTKLSHETLNTIKMTWNKPSGTNGYYIFDLDLLEEILGDNFTTSNRLSLDSDDSCSPSLTCDNDQQKLRKAVYANRYIKHIASENTLNTFLNESELVECDFSNEKGLDNDSDGVENAEDPGYVCNNVNNSNFDEIRLVVVPHDNAHTVMHSMDKINFGNVTEIASKKGDLAAPGDKNGADGRVDDLDLVKFVRYRYKSEDLLYNDN